jgi:hypothetical protein
MRGQFLGNMQERDRLRGIMATHAKLIEKRKAFV